MTRKGEPASQTFPPGVARSPHKSRSQRIKESEVALYGWNACLRAFERRPKDLLRLYFSKERAPKLAAAKAWCRENKLPYRLLENADLEKAAGTVHHEGVVMVLRPLKLLSVHDMIRGTWPDKPWWLALDQVSNPHNVGAVLRSCAFFGATGMLLSREGDQAQFGPSAARMAEGGLETTPVYECGNLPSALRDLRSKKVFVLGLDSRAKTSLYDLKITFPCAVVLGNEREGLSAQVKSRCDQVARIPGTADMESLNVSVAAGVVLAEMARQRRGSPRGQMA